MTPRALFSAALISGLFASTVVDALATPALAQAAAGVGRRPRATTKPPAVRILRAKTDNGKTGEICLKAEGGSGPELHVELTTLDGATIPRLGVAAAPNSQGCPTAWNYSVNLLPGPNAFRAIARDTSMKTRPDTVVTTLMGERDSTRARLHIMAVGIDEYPSGVEPRLYYAVSDARAFVDSLRSQSGPLFDSVLVYPLYDRAATKEAVVGMLDSIRTRVDTLHDTFVFYFAGHGTIANGHLFLALSEVSNLSNTNTVMLTTKGIKDGDLIGLIEDIRAKANLLVLDACRTGQMVEAFRQREAKDLNYMRRANVGVLAATDSAGLAVEKRGAGGSGGGLFTAAVLRAQGDPGRQIFEFRHLQAATEKFLNTTGSAAQPMAFRPPHNDFRILVR